MSVHLREKGLKVKKDKKESLNKVEIFPSLKYSNKLKVKIVFLLHGLEGSSDNLRNLQSLLSYYNKDVVKKGEIIVKECRINITQPILNNKLKFIMLEGTHDNPVHDETFDRYLNETCKNK